MIRYETAVQSQPIPGTYTMTGYVYDAAGNRVAKGTILTMSCDPSVNGYQATNDYVRGPGQVAQSNATKPYPRRNETVPRSSQSYRDERALTTVPMPAPNHTEGAPGPSPSRTGNGRLTAVWESTNPSPPPIS